MAKRNPNYYAACDRMIKATDREIVEAFGRLKMTDWEKVNIIRTVVSVYRTSMRKARKRYWEVAFEAYVLGWLTCDVDAKKAQTMADKAITMEWVDNILEQTDPVTMYRFDSEAERKAYRLAETLEVTPDRNRAIDRAMKEWSRQIGQYAIEFTDEAVVQAFEDAGVEEVEWVIEDDDKTCSSCREYRWRKFAIDEIPPKPHYGCRCTLKPIE